MPVTLAQTSTSASQSVNGHESVPLVAVHAAWRPGEGTHGGALVVWGEGAPAPGQRSARVVPVSMVMRWIHEVTGTIPEGVESSLRIALPSRGGHPVPSDREATPGFSTTWSLHEVPVLALSPIEALRVLPRLPATERRLGASLGWCATGARLALEWISRGRFVPWLEESGDPTKQALWRPVATDDEDRSRVANLAAVAPAAALALADGASARRLLDDYLTSLVDQGVREACHGTQAPRDLDDTGKAWIEALFSEDGGFFASRAGSGKLLRALQEWGSGLDHEEAFRVSLRVEAPGVTADEIAVPGQRAKWRLVFALEASDDPSLFVPAERVWQHGGDAVEFRSRGVKDPEEPLLTGLGRAARVSPVVAKSLQSTAPTDVLLDTADAERFIREEAPRLVSAGIQVHLPGIAPLQKMLKARLRVRPSEKPKKTEAPARFGLDALVEYDYRLTLGGQELSEEEFEALAQLKAPLVRVKGQWVALQPGDVEAARRILDAYRKVSLGEVLDQVAAGETNGIELEEVHADGWIAPLLDPDASVPEAPPKPKGLKARLRPYQEHGLAWLGMRRARGLGALLADDMGLGKTLQLLATELALREAGNASGPSLVVCPASVAGNWVRESERFTPQLDVLLYHGDDRPRGKRFKKAMQGHDLVVTTYALLAREADAFARIQWDSVVLDEAQNIKNPASKTARAARRLEARWRAALTGTPVENRLSELWSIYAFLLPGYLGSQEAFRRQVAIPVERHGNEEQAARLRRLVSPFFLRRLKSDPKVIRDLPEKNEMTVAVNLTKEQATLYEGVLRDMLERIETAEGMERRGLVLGTLTRLKQVCNHPVHLLGDSGRLPGRSGKLERLVEMLDEALAEDDRCLVFTQYKEMGMLLQKVLQERFDETPFLHGGTPRKARDALVERFQGAHGPRVMLVSLKAGGTGLNLTAANRVFHYDRWWNPAVEDQATDRAYRIGQKRAVHVHKFLCVGTLEERIDAVLREKKSLADRVVGTGEGWITELDDRQLRDLLALRPTAMGGD